MSSVRRLDPDELAVTTVPSIAAAPLGPEPEPVTIPVPRECTVTLTVTTAEAQTAVDVATELGATATSLARDYLGQPGFSATVSVWAEPVRGDGG
jgi:hypothetical protein